jgi:hypothetical protein
MPQVAAWKYLHHVTHMKRRATGHHARLCDADVVILISSSTYDTRHCLLPFPTEQVERLSVIPQTSLRQFLSASPLPAPSPATRTRSQRDLRGSPAAGSAPARDS